MPKLNSIKSMQYLIIPDKNGKLRGNAEATPPVPLSSLIIGNANIGIFVINPNYRCIYTNKEMANILGYSVNAIMGCDIMRIPVMSAAHSGGSRPPVPDDLGR